MITLSVFRCTRNYLCKTIIGLNEKRTESWSPDWVRKSLGKMIFRLHRERNFGTLLYWKIFRNAITRFIWKQVFVKQLLDCSKNILKRKMTIILIVKVLVKHNYQIVLETVGHHCSDLGGHEEHQGDHGTVVMAVDHKTHLL